MFESSETVATGQALGGVFEEAGYDEGGGPRPVKASCESGKGSLVKRRVTASKDIEGRRSLDLGFEEWHLSHSDIQIAETLG